MVKLLPHQALSPFLGTARIGGAHAVALAEQVDVGVGRHLAERVRHRLRVLHVRVAPPEHGLHPLELREAAMVPRHGAQLGVDASLYPVVRRRHRALDAKLRVQVGEQRAGVDQADQPRARLPQAPVCVLHAPVDQAPLLEEVSPEPAPLHEALGPHSACPGVSI